MEENIKLRSDDFVAEISFGNYSGIPVPTHQSNFNVVEIVDGFLVRIRCLQKTKIFQGEANGITIILNGEIYEDITLEQLAKNFRNQGCASALGLKGNSIILIIDRLEKKVVVITDQLGSKAVYITQKSEKIILSTSLGSLYQYGVKLDPVGLAWYLSNGVPHNNRTLFEGVRKLNYATCCEIKNNRIADHAYWKYEFTYEYAGKSEQELKCELSELLVTSVRRKASAETPIVLSLSVGYDVSGILAIMGKTLGLKNIQTFSYGLNDPEDSSDPFLARKFAEKYRCAHSFLHSYNGDLVDAIEVNAGWWDGASNFCDEAQTWVALEKLYSGLHYPLYTGDECFGWTSANMISVEDALNICMLSGFDNLEWFKKNLSKITYDLFKEGLAEDISAVIRRCPDTNNLSDTRDFLYFDQRKFNVIEPWRENYAGRIFDVQVPYTDHIIIDFVKKIPAYWRNGKRLYRETITEMFPDDFASQRARIGGYTPNWKAEFQRHHEIISRKYIWNGTSTLLDDFIPPEILNKLLSMQGNNKQPWLSLLERIQPISIPGVNKWLKTKEKCSSTRLLQRCLVLRRYLEKLEENNAKGSN
jgi:asparagine synthase (glutamine-hydrolysing)